MTLITRPPVRYPGGKWRIGQWIIDKFPPHLSYVEPYCGGASVLFQKPPSYFEVINDLDGSVVNFFTVLRTCTDELMRAIDLTPGTTWRLSGCGSRLRPLTWAGSHYSGGGRSVQ